MRLFLAVAALSQYAVGFNGWHARFASSSYGIKGTTSTQRMEPSLRSSHSRPITLYAGVEGGDEEEEEAEYDEIVTLNVSDMQDEEEVEEEEEGGGGEAMAEAEVAKAADEKEDEIAAALMMAQIAIDGADDVLQKRPEEESEVESTPPSAPKAKAVDAGEDAAVNLLNKFTDGVLDSAGFKREFSQLTAAQLEAKRAAVNGDVALATLGSFLVCTTVLGGATDAYLISNALIDPATEFAELVIIPGEIGRGKKDGWSEATAKALYCLPV